MSKQSICKGKGELEVTGFCHRGYHVDLALIYLTLELALVRYEARDRISRDLVFLHMDFLPSHRVH
jgi:hypothetical protein